MCRRMSAFGGKADSDQLLLTNLDSLTEPKFPASGTSYDIDARVKAILQKGLSVYRVDAEKLQALRADIIVTQDHCEVYAASKMSRRR
jgi:iron complex transport system substrate-binding protein